MIRALILWLLTVMVASANAQTLNQKAFDTKSNTEILTGYCSRDGFEGIKSNFDSAFKAGYRNYVPDAIVIAKLTRELKKVNLTVVMATWCSDSRDWVPALYKILDLCGYDFKRLTLICVDRSKNAANTNVDEIGIQKVPTFIFYRRKK